MEKPKVKITEDTNPDDESEISIPNDTPTPIAFQEKQHYEKIVGRSEMTQTWRMKERMKTVSVALVLCLNVGVDPPDVVKTSPCARKECWIDPLSHSPQKALDSIGNSLQKQYERWQPRARYKQSLDPTVEDIKRLCTSLRRNAKEERVLFHYNGHGVPRPTTNGEIWVFNKTYTQYIPLSIYDLQSWMGSPSIFVYDCSCAGLIVSSFKSFADQRQQDMKMNGGRLSPGATMCDVRNCIQLAACSATQLLPMNPELPADLFTACLTTPIKIALQWFCHQRQDSLSPGVTLDLIEKIPGRLNDRRTPLGELNWIFTAITDTIAWNTLPRELFQKLFRQDLLVASLFRNFLLAERIMRSYKCTPVSQPALPPTFRHPMWVAWDHAVEVCLSQLPLMLAEESTYVFKNSPFFAQHLTAFQVWLSLGVEGRDPPEQLPIVLQVLLSQVHRLRALDLLGRFLDLGPWAVSLALSVGIFPYVLKLLQSLAKELRPLLVFIWAKILAVDSTCQGDLVKDGGHQYFLRALQDPQMSASHRTMAAFVLAEVVNGNSAGQEACLTRNIVSICLGQLDDETIVTNPKLKQWVAICLGRVWTNYDEARWRGVRDQAHERLYELLNDPQPEVRTAAVFALGTFVDNQPDSGSDHAAHVNQAVGATLTPLQRREASVLVRCELTCALQRLVACYDSSFATIAFRFVEEEKNLELTQSGGKNRTRNTSTSSSSYQGSRTSRSSNEVYLYPPANYPSMVKQGAGDSLSISPNVSENNQSSVSASFNEVGQTLTPERIQRLRKISLSNVPFNANSAYSSVNANIWKVLLSLAADPHPEVAILAVSVVTSIMERVALMAKNQNTRYCGDGKGTSPQNSPKSRRKVSFNEGEGTSPAKSSQSILPIHLTPYPRTRKVFEKGPEKPVGGIFRASEVPTTMINLIQDRVISTDFCGWSASEFAEPTTKVKETTINGVLLQKSQGLDKSYQARNNGDFSHQKMDLTRLGDQQFFNKNPQQAIAVKFHPHNKTLLAADRYGISMWEWESGQRKSYMKNNNPMMSSITCLHFINLHIQPMLMVGTDDGCVRVWKNCCSDGGSKPELVTAWQAISDNVPSSRGSGITMSWYQDKLQLFAAGDSRHLHIWDVKHERKVQELLTGAESCVTSLSHSDTHNILSAGCGDGTIRLFDTREFYLNSKHQKVIQAHDTWVINSTFLQHDFLLTASEQGDIKLWDVRKMGKEAYRTIRNHKAGSVRFVDVHPNLPVIACGTATPSINFLGIDGEELCGVKYYDGFLGQRIGQVTCMTFHPWLATLAVGTADSNLTVYSGESKGST
uniref:Regulatory-associated protein of mTOR-like n=1 Tax=Phallusia mammillata TaxID=59560 RepID=A0A6F9DRZ4_9ASCI|nr:regulatory-associated protein of mTOR-like [Phallusia mammillata]